ncbi:MAG: type II secretion system protein [Comamonadaceae bacterium]|nr:MAG: type II secretion system protein [Comamonadaceae bacterium]
MTSGLRQRGMTLLELLVAFAILALSLGMLYRAMGSGARSAGDVERYQRAALLAESVMALRDAVPEQGWRQSGESGGFRWQVSSVPFATGLSGPTIPALHEVAVVVTWSDGERYRNLELFTLRPQRKPPEPGRPR